MTTYVQIGRGKDKEAVTLSDELVGIITQALSAETIKGKMTAVGTCRSVEGTELSNQLFALIRLLEEKHD